MSRPEAVTASPVRQRRLALEGAINCRDLGGYETVDGRRVRWGQVYRSDALSELTDADLVLLRRLGLRSICDLRHEAERRHRPNRIDDGAGVAVHALGFYPRGAETLLQQVRSRSISEAEARATLQEIYRRLPLDQTAVYARLLDLLLDADALPALIHCTSGKDRTGFAAVVVLLALGVPRETIEQDYCLTNQYRRDLSFLIGSDIDAAVLDAVTAADRDYLAAAFRSIDETWGSDAAFLQQGLQLSPERQQCLQQRLLEDGDA